MGEAHRAADACAVRLAGPPGGGGYGGGGGGGAFARLADGSAAPAITPSLNPRGVPQWYLYPDVMIVRELQTVGTAAAGTAAAADTVGEAPCFDV